MPKRRRTHITQSDVATHANVSQAMVSYVVNNNSNISIPTETRQRILEAIDELGYVPNITARRLRTNKTLTIAGIIPDIMNPFYPAFERGIQDVVDANGCVDSILMPQLIDIGDPPLQISSTDSSLCIGEILTFTNISNPDTPFVSWFWDFGDGNQATVANPTHTYTAPGQYTVILTATDAKGCVATDTLL
ncbi:MAG: PKD domain-containing protein, partial [Chloroflexota bacterium]